MSVYEEMIIVGVVVLGTGVLIYTSSATIIKTIGGILIILGGIVLFGALAGISGEKKKQ